MSFLSDVIFVNVLVIIVVWNTVILQKQKIEQKLFV